MSITNKLSKDNFQNEINFVEFKDNTYEQITEDITKILNEMQKEKQNYIKDDANFNKKFFEDKANAHKEININLIPNINNNFIRAKMYNYYNNKLLINNQLLKYTDKEYQCNNKFSNKIN